MKTGVHAGLSFDEYVAIPAANKSGLDRIEQSPLHYWARYVDPKRVPDKETPAKRRGKAIHHALLEPELYEREYRTIPEPEDYPSALVTAEQYKEVCRQLGLAVGGAKDALKKRIQEASTDVRFFDDIEAEYTRGNFRLISKGDAEIIKQIESRISKSLARQAIMAPGKSEVTAVWTDQETGVLCKARFDWLTDDLTVIADVKSTEDASPDAFSRSCAIYNYHRQAAWYIDAVMAATGADEPLFCFLAYETDVPYAPNFFYPTREMIQKGREENRALLAIYAKSRASGEWQGYSDELKPIDLPAWRYGKPYPTEAQPI